MTPMISNLDLYNDSTWWGLYVSHLCVTLNLMYLLWTVFRELMLWEKPLKEFEVIAIDNTNIRQNLAII